MPGDGRAVRPVGRGAGRELGGQRRQGAATGADLVGEPMGVDLPATEVEPVAVVAGQQHARPLPWPQARFEDAAYGRRRRSAACRAPHRAGRLPRPGPRGRRRRRRCRAAGPARPAPIGACARRARPTSAGSSPSATWLAPSTRTHTDRTVSATGLTGTQVALQPHPRAPGEGGPTTGRRGAAAMSHRTEGDRHPADAARPEPHRRGAARPDRHVRHASRISTRPRPLRRGGRAHPGLRGGGVGRARAALGPDGRGAPPPPQRRGRGLVAGAASPRRAGRQRRGPHHARGHGGRARGHRPRPGRGAHRVRRDVRAPVRRPPQRARDPDRCGPGATPRAPRPRGEPGAADAPAHPEHSRRTTPSRRPRPGATRCASCRSSCAG